MTLLGLKLGFARDIGWVFLWLTVAGVGAYALNTLGFRDYIDAYLEVFSKYDSMQASVSNESEIDNVSESYDNISMRLANQ